MAEARKVEDEQRRIRTLTVKGQEDFQSKVYLYTTELEHAWSVVKKELDKTISFEGKASELKSHEQAVCFNYGEFRIKFNQFHDFLDRTRSEDSNQLLRKLSDQGTQRDKQVNSVLNTLDSRKIDMDNQSQHSHKSKASSSRSSVSSKGSLVARAKLEGAKARMRVLEEEIELRKKQALLQEERAITIAKSEREDKEYEANISLLQEKKAIAEAAAETEVYETEQNENEHERVDQNYVNERTSQFILDHPVEKMSVIHTDGVNVKSPQPPSNHNIDNVTKGELHVGEQIGRFLVKKDMLINRFTKFDDDPVHYNVWKNTFRSVAVELGTSASEEIDLLVKWLGPETTRQALSIRVASSYNPESGLLKIWERLDARYGAPELVEKSTQKKVTNFAKITANNYHRLYELTDILSEIESLKEDPQYSVLLSYYDSSVGVNPIISKLPYHLQNKWFERARKYKVSNNITYPPFTFFVSFIKEICSLLNDPSFVVESPQKVTTESYQNPRKQDRYLSAKKTDVEQSTCPLHPNAIHTLDSCREFRKRPIEERRQFLKDKGMCFRCCITNEHRIKDCKADIKCSDCGSVKHTSALHIYRRQNESSVANCKCTNLCGEASKSCAKIVSATICHKDRPNNKMKVYAVIDDQSNRSLGTTELFDMFGESLFEETQFILASCNGKMQTRGRLSRDFVIEANGNEFHIPSVTECPDIPDNRDEIPTPDIAQRYSHLRSIADEIPPLSDAPLALLIGRDLPEAHHVLDQIVGTEGPYSQRLHLGWVLVGETCLGSSHTPRIVRVNKTFIRDDHLSIFPPCESYRNVKDNYGDIFLRSPDDNKVGLSVEDRAFLSIMDAEFTKEDTGKWVAPLPFRADKPQLPNNRSIALKRAMYLDASLKRDASKKKHFVEFMAKVLNSGAAEVAPQTTSEVWYLPIFGIYHPRKPGKIRGVFDSSAVCKGTSLNSTLLSGPNMTNNLLGVLLRFRKDKRTVEGAEDDVREFVNDNFYVDDGLTSLPDPNKAISLMKRTQSCLQAANLRLHKIASNCKEVMKAFPEEDLQSSLKTLNLETEDLPMNQSLGLIWDLNADCFRFDIKLEPKPYTRRGLLSTLNSIYDPLGFVSPVIICGKMLLREITTGYDWDEPLDKKFEEQWKSWQESLLFLQDITIPRMYSAQSLSEAGCPELHIYSDASEKAVSAVAYIRTLDGNSVSSVGFVMGKSKLAPTHGHTIPRLELCAAVLASEIGDTIIATLKIEFQVVKFYSDSRVTLGYITNLTRRFYNYVANRVQKILHLTRAEQWTYIYTKDNPADVGSRGCSSPDKLKNWLDGPKMLWRVQDETNEDYPLISPDNDREVRHEVTVKMTTVARTLSEKFGYFSNWKRLVKAIMLLKRALRKFKTKNCTDGDDVRSTPTVNLLNETGRFILKLSQQESFYDEVKCLTNSKPVCCDSPISSLNPYVDEEGIMRVGGRLNQGPLTKELSNPIVLSSKCHISTLLVRHFHESCNHQGRHLTEGSLRYNGYWIVGAKRLVSSLLHKCVTCRKLRRKTEHQLMADLPEDRLSPGPPFSYVGVDVFGPWAIVSRRTRGGMAQSKRWAVLFTCLTTRAVHIEVIEEMSSSSFINALRRFVSLRGNVKEFRSDRGTNFVGAIEDLKMDAINVEDQTVAGYLNDSRVIWRFNAPHSSHMGGVWERMIGVARRILDGLLLKANARHLTHEVLVTLMAEISAIMNSRPIAPISYDAEYPTILTPAMLLNQKINCDISFEPSLGIKDMYRKQWKAVQVLADMFWSQWKQTYLETLQPRRKWKTVQPCVKNNDVVLLKDSSTAQ